LDRPGRIRDRSLGKLQEKERKTGIWKKGRGKTNGLIQPVVVSREAQGNGFEGACMRGNVFKRR